VFSLKMYYLTMTLMIVTSLISIWHHTIVKTTRRKENTEGGVQIPTILEILGGDISSAYYQI